MNVGNALKSFVNSKKTLVLKELERTKSLADYAAQDQGWSLVVPFLETANRHGAYGADKLLDANKKLHYYANRADTALGAILRGDSKDGSIRHWLFTKKKGSYVPLNNNGVIDTTLKDATDFRVIPRASISTPIEGALGIAGTSLLAEKIYRLRHPEYDTQQEQQY